MDGATRAAFRAALYRFDAPNGELLLKVDEPCPPLRILLQLLHAESMAVVTAFNPQGRRRNDAENAMAQELLRREIADRGWPLIPGRNEDPSGAWPVEDSFLVAGICLADACTLATHHDQLAFLWTDISSATPRLIELTGPHSAGIPLDLKST